MKNGIILKLLNKLVRIGDLLIPFIEKELTEEKQQQVDEAALQDAPDGSYSEGIEEEEDDN